MSQAPELGAEPGSHEVAQPYYNAVENAPGAFSRELKVIGPDVPGPTSYTSRGSTSLTLVRF